MTPISSRQIDNWLNSMYTDVRKTNISGAKFWSHPGFPDYYVPEIDKFIEVKRGNEKITDQQKEWIEMLGARVYRFWDKHVDIYSSKLVRIRSIRL